MRTLLLLLTLLLAAPVQARMYQWVSPQSGITQLSGTPPPWYRSGTPGPRVFVFEDGRIIDDTAIKVTPAERERLHEQAFRQADELAKAAPAAPAQQPEAASSAPHETAAEAPGESAQQSAEEAEAEAAAEPPAPDAGTAQSVGKTNAASTQSTIERLKAIIANWDKKQTEHAKDVLETENQLKQFLKTHPSPNAGTPDTGP